MPKILITNTNVSWNKGSAAQVISVVCNLRRFAPEAEFTLLSYCPKLDSNQCSKYDISVIGYFGKKYKKHRSLLLVYSLLLLITVLNCIPLWLLRAMRVNTKNMAIKNKFVREYAEADLILDLSGDSFSDRENISIINMLALLPAILLKKPFVFFSQSIGPFNFWTLPLARCLLNNSSLLVVRENVTGHYLKRVGVKNSHVCLAADCAFLLEPAPLASVLEIRKDYRISEQERPLIGISLNVFMINHSFTGRATDYLSIMSRLIDYIVESKNAYVVLIPHVITPIDWEPDDIYAIRAVQGLLKNKRRIMIIENNHDARELKGIIGHCDLFIGCRMHANIAALSQGVPTIAVGWSHKYYGIMKRLGMEEYACYLDTMSFEELKAKVDMLFSLREEIQNQLKSIIKDEKRSALRAVKLLRNLLPSC